MSGRTASNPNSKITNCLPTSILITVICDHIDRRIEQFEILTWIIPTASLAEAH